MGKPKSEDLNWHLTAPATVNTTDNPTSLVTTDDSPTHTDERQLGEPENDAEEIHENQLN